jgi:hypothetical protein
MRLYYLISSEFEPKAYMAQIIGSKGPLSKPTTAAQPWRRELVFMPLNRPCQREGATVRSGGKAAFPFYRL